MIDPKVAEKAFRQASYQEKMAMLYQLAALDYEKAERSFSHFFKAAWHVLEPTTPRLDNWHQEAIAEYLEAVLAGDIKRLIINMPPRYSKSLLVTVMFPAWCWIKDPSMKFINASYAEDLAVKHAVDRRILMQSPWYQSAWSDRFQFSSEQNQKSEYLNDKRGHCVAVGMLGAVTGKGGDCLTGEALVDTEIGQFTIAELVDMPYKPRVASFNHNRNCLEFREIEACKVTYASEFIEVETESGRRITSTPDHLFYCPGRGYVAAKDLAEGETLSAKSSGKTAMRSMQNLFYASSIRGKQASKKRSRRRLLRPRMLSRSPRNQKSERLRGLPDARSSQDAAFLRSMQADQRNHVEDAFRYSLSALRNYFSTDIKPDAALFPNLRERNAFGSNERLGELDLQGRKKLLDLVRQNEQASNHSSRRSSMRRLQMQFPRRSTFSASYRRESSQQSTREPDSIVSTLSHETPQVEMRVEKISLVRRIRGERKPVYDLQIEGNRNFLAQGILVHNCVIIDDPHNPKKAESEAERKAAIEAFDSTFTTRLDNKQTGRIIVVMQRLHHRDLTGHLLDKKERGENWTHLKLPAEAPRRTLITLPMSKRKILREQGDVLHASREGPKELAAMKVSLGSYNYAGQYEQNPTPRSGGLFRKSYWRYYTTVPDKFDEMIQSWDLTFKDATKSDFVAGFVLARKDADIYILDCKHARMSFGVSKAAVLDLSKRWPFAFKKLIENKANGPAIQDDLKSKIGGIVLEEPQGSKIERAAFVEPFFEAGNILIPHPSIAQPWVQDLVNEAAAFPKGEHDDMVDALTQGVKYLVKGSIDRLMALGRL